MPYVQDSPWLEKTPETEVAWAAGFFDGEGCFSVYKRKNGKPRIKLQVSQKDVRLLHRFREAVGAAEGAMYTSPDGTTNLIFNKQGLSLSVLNLIWPYLGPFKKEQFIAKLGV